MMVRVLVLVLVLVLVGYVCEVGGSSLGPGVACLNDGECGSGVCRERSANVLDIVKVCCLNGTDTSCKSCKSGAASDAGVCLSYGTCNSDTDCASGVCRQGDTTSAGTKACCAPGVPSTCQICVISNVTVQSTVLAFNNVEGGQCVQVTNGGSCKLYDDECIDGTCVFPFLGSPLARCCKDVGASCTECSDQGQCIANSCSTCVGGETCVSGFTGPSNGCCKASVDAATCDKGCDLNGNCIRNPEATILDYLPTLLTFILILLMFVAVNFYVRYKLLPEEEANRVGIDGYGNAPVRVLSPTYEGDDDGGARMDIFNQERGAVNASFVRDSLNDDDDDVVTVEIVGAEAGNAQSTRI